MTDFPGIRRAALKIAYDNGGINRSRSERQMLTEFEKWIAVGDGEHLPAIDAWLAALSDSDLETVCCGESGEIDALLAGAPPFTNDILNQYFEEVC